MTEQLKPCPCCGETDIKVIHHSDNVDGQPLRTVNCTSCGLRTMGYSKEAIKKWNYRQVENKLRTENEVLKQELQWFRDIARESEGVIGIHLNGDIATWEYLGVSIDE